MVVSKSGDSGSSSKSKKSNGSQSTDAMRNVIHKLSQLKKQIQSERAASVRDKIERNRKALEDHVSELLVVAGSRVDEGKIQGDESSVKLSLRMENPFYKVGGLVQGDRDSFCGDEVISLNTAKLPFVEKLPSYTTWIFLDRNQRMAEDQSVVGRRQIYYDQHGSEALIWSDSEEENIEPGTSPEFSEGEDRILWMVAQEYCLDGDILNTLTQFVRGTTSEIEERCLYLRERNQKSQSQNLKNSSEDGSEESSYLSKSLDAALDSFDNLFCRRCLVFDCRLHGCSQTLIHSSEKQPYCPIPDEDGKPCSDQCYLALNSDKNSGKVSVDNVPCGSKLQNSAEEDRTRNLAEPVYPQQSTGKRSGSNPVIVANIPELISDGTKGSGKKPKLVVSTAGSIHREIEDSSPMHQITEMDRNLNNTQHMTMAIDKSGYPSDVSDREGRSDNNVRDIKRSVVNGELTQARIPTRTSQWKPLEKDLYLKGVEIFGKNSCLIARNLLLGLKTCMEVFKYMHEGATAREYASSSEDNRKHATINKELEASAKSRLFRRRGRTRRLKYSSKSAGHPSVWRRFIDGKDQPYKQYTPCGCTGVCGKQCSCLQNETCCEKYCGCSKSCKNRFRGCHCARSQCRSRQCPCFAARRECDPDVCRNCWISCGDGSLGHPPKRGDGQCGNMRLLLRQQQRILLAKSEVAGWGAFLKNSVNKNDYLGEYTGELISHYEADKRGKIYDRANSSFLFDLNDQYVLDAFRKGDKLKFANHSANPNCYAKVMMVAGDHRVGIFAKERIEACEEIFYDYCYGPDEAPFWARKPENLKKDDPPPTQGRAKKHQSH